MGWRLAADTVLVVHLAFVVFIVVGGFAVRGRPRLRLLHLATLAYGAAIELVGFTCPLTPFEKSLRVAAGQAGYEGGFVDHYVVSVLYPGELTVTAQALLIASVAAVNVAAYLRLWPRPVPAR